MKTYPLAKMSARLEAEASDKPSLTPSVGRFCTGRVGALLIKACSGGDACDVAEKAVSTVALHIALQSCTDL